MLSKRHHPRRSPNGHLIHITSYIIRRFVSYFYSYPSSRMDVLNILSDLALMPFKSTFVIPKESNSENE
jgi:hypothetical protein